MTEIIIAVSTVASGILGLLIGRRKQNAETLAKEIFNVDKALEIWKELALDLKAELEEVSNKCERLTKGMEELAKENRLLKEQLTQLTVELKKH